MTLLRQASLVGVVAVVALLAAGTRVVGASTATASATLVAGTFNLQTSIRVTSNPVDCPPEGPVGALECRARTGSASIPGLGSVSESYVWGYGSGSPPCPSSLVKPLATSGRLVVTGKGELHFSLAEGVGCVDVEPVRNEPQTFVITGGTGSYEGASGSGTLGRSLSGGIGSERWTGTLVAPGVEFDLSPPTLSGARSKTVRARKGAKSVRVRYTVTASDNVDSQVPVTCTPRSGSRFRIGRTVVRCSATDSSGNTGTASFRVTVRAARSG